jgi:omega-6 fatty acid desaturase (delta-12 desaturase)
VAALSLMRRGTLPGSPAGAVGTVGLATPPTSLKPVIDVLPASVYENPTWRGMSYFLRDAAMYVALLAILVVVSNIFAVLALEVLMGVVVSGLFVVGHDAAHGALFSSKRMNSTVAHIAMLPSFHVYEGWVLGHNRVHHPYTVRQGYDFVWHPTTPEQFAEFGWWRRAVHRFEWSWAGAGAYYAHQVWWTKMMVGSNPARWVKAIRRDRWIVTAFIAGMLALFTVIGMAQGHSVAGILWLDVRTVVLPFVGFAYLIGTVVHTHHIAPDIRWWKKAEWNKYKAQMEGTTVLRVPKGFNFFLHWIMVHVPHHVDMRVPMYHLEEAADAIEAAFPGTIIDKPLRFSEFVANSRACKLYDFDAGRWLTYAEGRRHLAST